MSNSERPISWQTLATALRLLSLRQKGQRAWRIFIGLGVFFALIFLSDWLGLTEMNWLLRQVLPFGPVVIVILLYPEIRKLPREVTRSLEEREEL
jgi:DNA integrity scanning protein DisA with diadenylate cyclase activity